MADGSTSTLTNPVTGTGTVNYIPKWNGSGTSLTNSLIYDSGSVVSIGTASPDTSALFQMTSTTKGFLPPVMTATQRTSISSPAAGLVVYQSDGTAGLYIYTGGVWRALTMV